MSNSNDNVSNNSSDTNFPDNVWMDDKDVSQSDLFLGKIFQHKHENIEDVFNVVSNRAMLETEVWKTQMAIHDELIIASVTEREEKLKRAVKYEELLEENGQLKKIQSENEVRIQELTKKNTDLMRNICSLYKTAKAESERKDKMMFDINEELNSLKLKSKRHVRWENNHCNSSNLNDATNNKVGSKFVKPNSVASRSKSFHDSKSDANLDEDVRNDKNCQKTETNKKANFEEEKHCKSRHKSREDEKRRDSSRKRKRETSYKTASKYTHHDRDQKKIGEKSPYSYYKRSYNYHCASPRKKAKNVDYKDILKYVNNSQSPIKDLLTRTSKTESKISELHSKETDQSKSSEKISGNKTDRSKKELVHQNKKRRKVHQEICDEKNFANSGKNVEPKVTCSYTDDTHRIKVNDSFCSEPLQEHDKVNMVLHKDQPQNLEFKLLNTPASVASTVHSTSKSTTEVSVAHGMQTAEVHISPKTIVNNARISIPLVGKVSSPRKSTVEVYTQSEPVVGEVSDQPEPVVGEVSDQPEPVVGEVSDQPEPIVEEVSDHPKSDVAESSAQPKSDVVGEVSDQPEPVVGEVSDQPEPIVDEVSDHPKSDVVEASAQPKSNVAEVLAPYAPVASEVPVITCANGINSKDIIQLQTVDPEICSNSELESIQQNASASSSKSEPMKNGDNNLDNKNRCLDILEDKTTTNALFFGLLPIEVRRSFMEYEQQLIVNTNKLKQSFVNYYFRHYKGNGPSTHSDDLTTNDESLKEHCSANDSNNPNKDVFSPLFFFDEKNKMAMSINSNISPKTLSVDESNRKEHTMPVSTSQARDTAMSLLDPTSADNDDAHSDSTREIDVFQLDMIQRQLEKNKTEILPLISDFEVSTSHETAHRELSSAVVTAIPGPGALLSVSSNEADVPISVSDKISSAPVPLDANVPEPCASVAGKLSEPSLSATAEVSELFVSVAVSSVAQSSVPVSTEVQTSSVYKNGIIVSNASGVANSPTKSISVPTEVTNFDRNSSKNDESAKFDNESHTVSAKRKCPPEIQICYRDVPQNSYPQGFNSVYYRRQLLKTAIREQEEDGITKSTMEDLEKLYSYTNSKKPFVIRRKVKQ